MWSGRTSSAARRNGPRNTARSSCAWAGYSAYFVELSREVQDDILSRTVNTL